LYHAAAEEADHLAWCEGRLRELEGRTSVLNPLWYAGSFAIGASRAHWDAHRPRVRGRTERQVESHCAAYGRLGSADRAAVPYSRRMTHDEINMAQAASLGGQELPFPVGMAMRLTARLHDLGSYWL